MLLCVNPWLLTQQGAECVNQHFSAEKGAKPFLGPVEANPRSDKFNGSVNWERCFGSQQQTERGLMELLLGADKSITFLKIFCCLIRYW